jgi:hypothetical protein
MPNPLKTHRMRPAIPVPTTDPQSLYSTAMATKEAVDIMHGAVGTDKTQMVVRWQDLLDLQLIKPYQVPQ